MSPKIRIGDKNRPFDFACSNPICNTGLPKPKQVPLSAHPILPMAKPECYSGSMKQKTGCF